MDVLDSMRRCWRRFCNFARMSARRSETFLRGLFQGLADDVIEIRGDVGICSAERAGRGMEYGIRDRG